MLCRPEAFAALREIEEAMRVIEKADSPLKSEPQRTFNNTFWEPQAKAWPPYSVNSLRTPC